MVGNTGMHRGCMVPLGECRTKPEVEGPEALQVVLQVVHLEILGVLVVLVVLELSKSGSRWRVWAIIRSRQVGNT